MKCNEMKNETQHAVNIEDVLAKTEQAIFNTKTHRMERSIASTCDKGKGKAIELNNTTNIFLAQNKGKGPPGRQRSPVASPQPSLKWRGSLSNSPDEGTCAENTCGLETFPLRGNQKRAIFSLTSNFNDFETITNKTYNDYKFYKFNFSQLLNSIFMKKQLFILILAVFASVTVAFGQAIHDSSPIGITCKDDALHPLAGKPYDYSVLATPSGGNYLWWATKDPTFVSTAASVTTTNTPTMLTTTTGLTATSGNYGAAGTNATVTITWSDAILSTTKYQAVPNASPTVANPSPTFVAVLYDNVVCANNMKVYELNPIKAFTVDIKNIEDASMTSLGYTVSDTQCIDNVRSAKYVTGAMQWDYGFNTLYYEVVAANFTGSWTPTFTTGTLGNGQTTSSLQWTYDKPSTWTGGVPPSGWHAATDAVGTTATDTSVGVSIYVKWVIANNTFEGLAATTVTLAVDGFNSAGEWDIENNTAGSSTPLCNPGTANDKADVASQTINPRPTILENVDTTPTSPTPPQGLIPGNETN
jgi:hypothetical protein